MSNLNQTRREYKLMALDESTINPNPLLQFEQWISEAFDSANTDPSAMVLATSPLGQKFTGQNRSLITRCLSILLGIVT